MEGALGHAGMEGWGKCGTCPCKPRDEWSRIPYHQQAVDLARYRYFRGMQLQPAPPEVQLSSPALQFHPSSDARLRYLSPEIEIIHTALPKAGVAEFAWSCASNNFLDLK
jgi:hypothetical protein